MIVRPAQDRVLIRRVKLEVKTAGGIFTRCKKSQ
jgi:co-chaperonin GroES (HSP10)